jgi:hypothetical protein
MSVTPPPPPSPQDSGARPISFVLLDKTADTYICANNTLTLYIRPEDLTRSDSSRLSPQQTLGDTIWMDNFGPGMPTINISGHTGWRPAVDYARDGVERFAQLKKQVFTQWHASRQTAIKAGLDPDENVQLQFVDQLDQFACVVAPQSFVLRRSRSRPLLMQYQIAMIVVNDKVALPAASTFVVSAAQKKATGLAALANSINAIAAKIASVSAFINSAIAVPIAAFMRQTAALFSAVMNAINSVVGVTDSLIAVAALAAQCAVNVFRTLAAIAGLPNLIKQQIMELAAEFSNVLCVIENVFAQQLLYPDYDPLFGASNCSSTSGGRPPTALAGLNPFQYTNPQVTSDAVTATTQAQTVMRQVTAIDVVRSPLTLAQIGSMTGVIAAGILVSATPTSTTAASATTSTTTSGTTTTTTSGPAWATGATGATGETGATGPPGELSAGATFETVALASGAQTFTLPSAVSAGWCLLCVNGLRQSETGYSVSGATLTLPSTLGVQAGDLISFDYYPITA